MSNKSASDFVERHERKEIQYVPVRMTVSDWTIPCYIFTALKTSWTEEAFCMEGGSLQQRDESSKTQNPHGQLIPKHIRFFSIFIFWENTSPWQSRRQYNSHIFTSVRATLFLAAKSSDNNSLEVAWRATVTFVEETWDSDLAGCFFSWSNQVKHLYKKKFKKITRCLFVKELLSLFLSQERTTVR